MRLCIPPWQEAGGRAGSERGTPLGTRAIATAMPAAGTTVAGVGGAASGTAGEVAGGVATTAAVGGTGAGGNRSVYYGSTSSCFNCGSERLRRKYVSLALLFTSSVRFY